MLSLFIGSLIGEIVGDGTIMGIDRSHLGNIVLCSEQGREGQGRV